jgi:hypothetical protein
MLTFGRYEDGPMKGEYLEQLPDRPPTVQIAERPLDGDEPIVQGEPFPEVRSEQHYYRLARIERIQSPLDPSMFTGMAVYEYAPELASA